MIYVAIFVPLGMVLLFALVCVLECLWGTTADPDGPYNF